MRATRNFGPVALLLAVRLWAQAPANGVAASAGSGSLPVGEIGTARGGPPGSASAGSVGAATSIYVSGHVAMEDGSPLPATVAIQRVCSTSAQTVAWTDAKGGFGFRWGSSPAVPLDASQSGARNPAGVLGISPGTGGMMGLAVGNGSAGMGSGPLGAFQYCDLRASLTGYRSDVVNMTTRHSTDTPDLGTIVLHRAIPGEGSTVSATALAIPKAASDAFRRGIKAEKAGDKAGAKKEFTRAVAAYPDYADAWIELGLVNGRSEQWAESTRCLDTGLRLRPEAYPQAWYADAMAHYYLADFDAAERSAREALRLDRDRRYPRTGYVLGMVLAQKHDYESAAEQLRAYLEKAPNAPDAGQVKAQLAEIEGLK